MPARVLNPACGALTTEITALNRMDGWSHIDLWCPPPGLLAAEGDVAWHN